MSHVRKHYRHHTSHLLSNHTAILLWPATTLFFLLAKPLIYFWKETRIIDCLIIYAVPSANHGHTCPLFCFKVQLYAQCCIYINRGKLVKRSLYIQGQYVIRGEKNDLQTITWLMTWHHRSKDIQESDRTKDILELLHNQVCLCSTCVCSCMCMNERYECKVY